PAHAQLITRMSVAIGAINQIGDVDYYKFEAKAGQGYAFEVVGSALGSGLSGQMTITTSDGKVLARSDDFGNTNDPRMAFEPEKDGTYYIEIHDRQMMAGGFYRLRCADRVAVTDAFPLGVQKGKTAEIAVEGVGLH